MRTGLIAGPASGPTTRAWPVAAGLIAGVAAALALTPA
jgi:hypothetical protein